QRCHTNPARIFHLPPQTDTWIEVDPEAGWEIRASDFFSRCGWTPFEGHRVHGRVQSVTLRGQRVYENGRLLLPPGTGRNLRPRLSSHES
ncbi:MAG TPA: hypothetical protein PKG95_03285, partial [Anaerolineaceae bacterium]|nr:hypothetical protein [Anaerolineaceae bacterium]